MVFKTPFVLQGNDSCQGCVFFPHTICIPPHSYMHTHTLSNTHSCTHTCTHTNSHTHPHTHTHTHTHNMHSFPSQSRLALHMSPECDRVGEANWPAVVQWFQWLRGTKLPLPGCGLQQWQSTNHEIMVRTIVGAWFAVVY